ncbi:MAG TPA: tripartite tricarboxylate transporter substrate-binding protein [Candidatus Polarisedimenticolaceae bacterium]|nr:tripartite tricarboxylate transporter substrate-binding protein [Candidatus Polarisedimenticolaceae bacterium]
MMILKTFLIFFFVLFLTAAKNELFAAQSGFEGKAVRIVVGFSAGGGFDTYSRAIARHMGKHIPGNPSIVVENMTGAGSIVAANHVYRVAKPDGLTIGNFHGFQILNQVLGAPGIEFDARKLEWLGVPVQDTGACALTKASGIISIEQWQAARQPVKLGGVGPGDASYGMAKVLKEVLGLPVQPIPGYKGTADIRLAAEGGEIAGGCWQWESIKVIWHNGLETGDANLVLQLVAKPHPELPKVPLAVSLAKTDEARTLLQAAVHDPNSITRPYSLPPGTPKDRVKILQKAFMDTMKDPEFLADAKKSQLDIDPVSPEEVEKTVARFFKLDATLIAKLREILK